MGDSPQRWSMPRSCSANVRASLRQRPARHCSVRSMTSATSSRRFVRRRQEWSRNDAARRNAPRSRRSWRGRPRSAADTGDTDHHRAVRAVAAPRLITGATSTGSPAAPGDECSVTGSCPPLDLDGRSGAGPNAAPPRDSFSIPVFGLFEMSAQKETPAADWQSSFLGSLTVSVRISHVFLR